MKVHVGDDLENFDDLIFPQPKGDMFFDLLTGANDSHRTDLNAILDSVSDANTSDWSFLNDLLPVEGPAAVFTVDTEGEEMNLILATATGDLEQVRRILATERVIINFQAPETNLFKNIYRGDTALMIACCGGHLDIVQELLDARADPKQSNESGDAPMMLLTCADTNADKRTVLKLLLDGKADINQKNSEGFTPLMGSIIRGDTDLLQWALKNGAAVNGIKGGRSSMLDAAIRTGNLEIVKILTDVDAGLDLDTSTSKTSHVGLAAAYNSLDILKYLVVAKNQKPETIRERNTGTTPLILAASEGHWDIVNWLCARNDIEVNVTNGHGATALHYACKSRQGRSMTLLLERRANVNLRDSVTNRTPLEWADASTEADDFSASARALYEKAVDICWRREQEGKRQQEEAERKHLQEVEWAARKREIDKQRQQALLEKAEEKARRTLLEKKKMQKQAEEERIKMRQDIRIREMRLEERKRAVKRNSGVVPRNALRSKSKAGQICTLSQLHHL